MSQPKQPQLNQARIIRQAIQNTNRKIVAYKLFSKKTDAKEDLRSISAMLAQTLNAISLDKLLPYETKGYIAVNHTILDSRYLNVLNKERFILEIQPDTIVNDKTVQKIVQLKEQGYSFALEAFDFQPDSIATFGKVINLCEVVKVDVDAMYGEYFNKLQPKFEKKRIEMLAMKVDHIEQYRFNIKNGFTMFQGDYIAKRELVEGRKTMLSTVAFVLQILKLLQSDAETDEIADSFKMDAQLTLDVLTFMNNENKVKERIDSIEHAISMMGRAKLTRWLLMYMFAQFKEAGVTEEVNELAQRRARLMGDRVEKEHYDSAYMIGMLSIMPDILDLHASQLFGTLPLDEHVKGALIQKSGVLGEPLKKIIEGEKRWAERKFGDKANNVTLKELAEALKADDERKRLK